LKSAVLLLGLMLSACASLPKSPDLDATQQLARNSYLQNHPDWSFKGRLAYSHQGQGGTVQVFWRQNGSQSEIMLSAPLGIGAVKIRMNPTTAQVFDASGRLLQAGETQQLLQQVLHVAMPVASLMNGLRAYWPEHATVPYLTDASAGIDADGWQWRYQEWVTVPVRLPKKLETSRMDSRLRLIVDQWIEVADE
jgi:outer membrane lipoprotein LolB